MKKIIAMLSIASLAACSSNKAVKEPAAKEAYAAKLSMDEARAIALKEVPGTVVEEELEKEKGIWIYTFEIRSSAEEGVVKEVNIDADNGKVVSIEIENEDEDGDADEGGHADSDEDGDEGGHHDSDEDSDEGDEDDD